jgi:hypothetical protein
MATVSLTVTVPAPADTVWNAVCSPIGFRFVSRGLVYWPIAAKRTTRWNQGETVRGWIFFFGFVPAAQHSLTFERLDSTTREFRTDEHGGIIRSWRHSITVTEIDSSQCRIDDSVTFSGGVFTPLLTVMVRVFYAIRRPRWIALAEALVDGTLVV